MLALSLAGFLDALAAALDVLPVAARLPLVQTLRTLLAERFLVAVEGALSSLRHSEAVFRAARDLRRAAQRAAAAGRPLGALRLQHAFLGLLVAATALQVAPPAALRERAVLDHLLDPKLHLPLPLRYDYDVPLANLAFEIADEVLRTLDDGADYLELASPGQQALALRARGQALTVLLNCAVADEDADADALRALLEASLADPVQMEHEELAATALTGLAVLAKTSPLIATSLGRSLPRVVVQGRLPRATVPVAARCLASILQLISPDAVITGLYSLGNVLSAPSAENRASTLGARKKGSLAGTIRGTNRYTQHTTGSAISLGVSGDDEVFVVYANVVRAIVGVAIASDDERITSLAQSMLVQKLGRINVTVDLQIIVETARLGATGTESDLKSLLKLYDRLAHDAVVNSNDLLQEAVGKARLRLAAVVQPDTDGFQVYALHLLETIVSKGDLHQREKNTQTQDFELAASEICRLLAPLARLAPAWASCVALADNEAFGRLQREVWFNLAVHGVLAGSELWNEHHGDLQILARFSPPLVADDARDRAESDVALDTVLRRGMNAPRTASLKRALIALFPDHEASVRALEYARVVFLHAARSLEVLRATAAGGGCTAVLGYFVDPSVQQPDAWNCMIAVANEVVTAFLRSALGGDGGADEAANAAQVVAAELATAFALCCHRVSYVQQVATSFADRLVAQVPSALAQRRALFALLELLSLMWASCLDAELDEYEWKSHYRAALVPVSLELSDDIAFRRATLDGLAAAARRWVLKILDIAPWDVKGLLQSYLAESNDSGALGHVALGRSFALEMGLTIAPSDQRLAAIKRQYDGRLDAGSDFVYQYTTRQEYKHAAAPLGADPAWTDLLRDGPHGTTRPHDSPHSTPRPEQTRQSSPRPDSTAPDVQDAEDALAALHRRAVAGRFIPLLELRDVLQRAAALLCRSAHDHCAIVQYLVAIPFAILTEQSVKLGIAIWLGVLDENPRTEPRFVAQIAGAWEASVRRKEGAFSEKLRYHPPHHSVG